MPQQCIAGFGSVAIWGRRAWSSCRLGSNENLERGYRLIKTHDRRLLDEWVANWKDLVDLEVSAVTTLEEAGEKVAARIKQATTGI